MVKSGAVPVLIDLLQCVDAELCKLQELALWAIGNIAGDCLEVRNLVLQHQNGRVLAYIARLLSSEYAEALISTTT